LIKSLAEAGRCVKQVFAAVHGEGVAWFNVVPDLDDSEQEFARNECHSLIRRLSTASREFAFSASLADEVLPDFAWDRDSETPMGVRLDVLYKAVQAAARGYIEEYLLNLGDSIRRPSDPGLQCQLDEMELPRRRTPEAEDHAEKVESMYAAQTIMMEQTSELSQQTSELSARVKSLEERLSASDIIDADYDAALREAIGSRFDELSEETRDQLRSAERRYTHPQDKSDFSVVGVFLTKAFEYEHRRRVIEPLVGQLQPIIVTDSTFRGDLSTFNLGQYRALFKKYPLRIEPMFEQLGLEFKKVCNAIYRVNKYAGARHSANVLTQPEATEFRSAFFGRESVLHSLFTQQ
jgi:hypothetical protein